MWTFVNPYNDANYSLTGTGTQDAWINIIVPGGSDHQIHDGLNAPYLLQSANDSDFEVEVKFESSVNEQYQMQGIVVKQDETTFLRFELYGTASDTMLYARSYGTISNRKNIKL